MRRGGRQICGYCRGKGKEYTWGRDVSCYRCVGTGRDTKSDLWSEPCSLCNGKGTIRDCTPVTCRMCNGSGYGTY